MAAEAGFAFKQGDLVLVKWSDSMVYFAKIKKIDQRRRKCAVVFDDKSQDEADFGQIHSVDETTTDIICIKCKRDDSDSPNEIVLCDRCGIGYHQKCHSPPIPASALELDTPWNCTYCLRGTKCPYLTESLEVLQNLLSDNEEGQSHDERDSVTTAESDEGGDDFTTPAPPQHGKLLAPPKPQKKRGRKPKAKRGLRPKGRAKSPLVTDGVRFKKESSVESMDVSTTTGDACYSKSASPSPSSAQNNPHELRRKRLQIVLPANVRKRPRKSSVQSQTLSVTRILVPVHAGTNSALPEESCENTADHKSSEDSETVRSGHSLSSPKPKSPPIISANLQIYPPKPAGPLVEKKPRSLRVSLNLPEDVEPIGIPIKKHHHKLLSPKSAASSLPLWDDDLGPKTAPSSSTSTSPIKSSPSSGGKIVNLVSQRQGSIESRSPTPRTEDAPLTPFTASALPLQAAAVKSSVVRERKRSREEGEKRAGEDSLPTKRAKTSLKSPPGSPLDDVFASPENTEPQPVSVQEPKSTSTSTNTLTHTPASSQPANNKTSSVTEVRKMTHTPASSQPANSKTSSVTEVRKKQLDTAQLDSAILPPPPTATIPVGYGPAPTPGEVTSLTSAKDTPSVVPVAPLPDDKVSLAVDSTPSESASSGLPINRPDISKTAKQKESTVTLPKSPSVIKSPSGQGAPCAKTPLPSAVTSHPSQGVVTNTRAGQSKSDVCGSQTSGATTVSVITASAVATPTSSVGVAKPASTPKSTDSDIIITSVEIRPPATTTTSGSATRSNTTKPAPTASSVASTKSHYQSHVLMGKHKPALSGTRVTAKIADIQPGPVAPATGQLKSPPPLPLAAGKLSHTRPVSSPVISHMPPSMVPVVGAPTNYTQRSTDNTAATYTIIPTEAVVSGGQGVAIAIPSSATAKAVKPGSLPIKDSVVQQTPAVHYIFEPLVQTASTPVVYNKTTGVPVAVTYTQASSAISAPTYQKEVVGGSKAMPVTTTKPYAIVSAQPTASIEIQGVPINQQGTPLISPQVQLGYSSLSPTPYIQAAVNPSVDAKQPTHTSTASNWSSSYTKAVKVPSGGTRVSTSVSSSSGHSQREVDETATSQLEEIGRNISDAFANSSEKMFIAAFEDAWRKFQANGRRYQSASSNSNSVQRAKRQELVAHPKTVAPPNAEVVSVPGSSSRLSLIRPTSRSKISSVQSAPTDQLVCVPADTPVGGDKQQSVQFLYCSSGSIQPQIYTGTSEYQGTALYAIAPNTAQAVPYDHIVKHAQRQQGKSAHKTSQVQTSGIFIPAHGAELGKQQHQHTAVVVDQMGAKSMVQTARSQQHQQPIILSTEKGVSVQKQPDKVAVQHLSVLRKPQPIILDDHHQVMKHKTATSAVAAQPPGKAVNHQCAMCAKEATYLCSGCQRIWYCGKDCQFKAWDEHSKICRS